MICIFVIIYTHEEIKGAFMTFQEEADQIYPGWKEELDPAPKERPRPRLMNARRDGRPLPQRSIEKPKAPTHYSMAPADYCMRAWAYMAPSDSGSDA